jgi:hypothetical protein
LPHAFDNPIGNDFDDAIRHALGVGTEAIG